MDAECWFSVDPASRRWAGIKKTVVGRRPVIHCVLCLSSERDALALCLVRYLTQRRWFSVDPTFAQSLCFLQTGNDILLRGAFVEQRLVAGLTFQMLARHWPGLGKCSVFTLELTMLELNCTLYELLQETRKQQSSPVLKAAKLEPGVTLYIQNIHMPVGCDRTGVLNMKNKYASRHNDPIAAIRIRKRTVITNHKCDDVVGCRIIVSEDDAKKSLKPEYWPDGMSCRRWEDRLPKRDMPLTRYRGQEPRSSRYFYA